MSATTRLMMTRATLHCIGTVVALYVGFYTLAQAAMLVRITTYAFVWAACAGVYLLLLYCGQRFLDAFDDRIRRIVRDEADASEMRQYRRSLNDLVHNNKKSGPE